MVMVKCDECEGEIIESTGGFFVCGECGLTHDIILDDRKSPIYDDNGLELVKEKAHEIDTLILSTYSNPKKARSTDLKRALKLETSYTTATQTRIKIEIYIKEICQDLNITRLQNSCLLIFEKIKHLDFSRRKLENVAAAIVYLQMRLSQIPLKGSRSNYLLEFEKMGFDRVEVFRVYTKILQKFDFKPKAHDLKMWTWQVINSLIEETPKNARFKFLLAKYVLELTRKYQNLGSKQILATCFIYLLLKKSRFMKITQKSMERVSGYSDRILRTYAARIKGLMDWNEEILNLDKLKD